MSHKENNNTVLYIVIWLLIALVAGMWGFIASEKMWGKWKGWEMSSGGPNNSPVVVTVYDDARCTTCPTDQIINSMKNIPFLASASFEKKDFSEPGVWDFLSSNNISQLPAFVFSNGNVGDSDFQQVLLPINDGQFMIRPEAVWASFNPFAKRSEKWFLIVDTETIENIKANSYVKGNPDAKITWIEYSDLECPFCAKLHNSGTPKEIIEKYGDSLNVVFQHFPLEFHQNAKPGALITECLASQKWGDAFYALIDTAFTEENSNKSFLIDEAVKLGADKSVLEKCVDDKSFEVKIDGQQALWQELFKITGTPGNVLVNNETGEYEVISGAYPTESFTTVIDSLLQ